MTYLSSGIPIQVFELLLHYLEEVTGMEGYLITESRWSGPPAERGDPFIDDIADVGELWEWMCWCWGLNMMNSLTMKSSLKYIYLSIDGYR